MTSLEIERAPSDLQQLVVDLEPGEELVLTDSGTPMAKIVRLPTQSAVPRKAGSAVGKILYIAPDFDAPLEEFKEYMECESWSILMHFSGFSSTIAC